MMRENNDNSVICKIYAEHYACTDMTISGSERGKCSWNEIPYFDCTGWAVSRLTLVIYLFID
jgi:hypothetical protein